jgi:hypothetical protein
MLINRRTLRLIALYLNSQRPLSCHHRSLVSTTWTEHLRSRPRLLALTTTTASCSYNNVDLRGFTTAPELAPPISRHVDRDSGTFGVQSYDYPPDVEIAAEVGWDAYLLFHGYSFNSWSDVVTYDRGFIQEWMNSPQTSLYYSLQVQPDTQSKDDALAALDEDFRDLFGFEEDVDPDCGCPKQVEPENEICIPCGE